MNRRAGVLILLAGLCGVAALVLWQLCPPPRSPQASPQRAVEPVAVTTRSGDVALMDTLAPGPARTERIFAERTSVGVAGAGAVDSDEPPPAKELPSLTVRGRVVDEAGRPIAQAEVFVSDGWLEERDMLAVSDDDGRFEGETRLRSWGVMFSVFALGFAGTWREVDIHGGHELELGTFRLRPGAAIAGVVVDETGTPLAGAAVTRYPAEAFPTDIAAARRQRSGRFHRIRAGLLLRERRGRRPLLDEPAARRVFPLGVVEGAQLRLDRDLRRARKRQRGTAHRAAALGFGWWAHRRDRP